MLFAEYAADLAALVGPIADGAVLETAAGTGVVTRELREVLPGSSRLTATDLNPEMLDVAREHVGDGVELLGADATALPFGEGEFDAVVCQFGVMFFPDEAGGYREAARVLKPGGRFVLSVWDDLARNGIPGCLQEVFASLWPEDPPRFLQTPYRPLEMTKMLRDLQAAGFGEVRIRVLPKACRVASAVEAVETLLQSSPAGVELAQRERTEDGREAAVRALAERFAAGDPSRPFAAPMQAVVFEAVVAGAAGV